ncbi:MAG: hypothetical protein Q7S46_07100 [Gallionella sp.]|nr:hypothetical protein [Gallionella sp.]
MAKARNPITLSKEFGINQKVLTRLGVLDATLAIDTKLFVDPLLLSHSRHTELNTDAVRQYHSHFDIIIRLLANSRSEGDPAWKAAEKKLAFPEISGTCLGYGAGSIHGSGFGPKLTNRVLRIAAQIVEIGVRDPDLFSAMALFEPDIGPDRISDMTTNIIIDALAAFNTRVLGELGLRGKKFSMGQFLVNPYEEKCTPIILIPTDILRKLPVAHDWDGIANAARRNEELRNKINKHVALIWMKKTKRDKSLLKSQALSNKDAFETLLKAIKSAPAQPYDITSDPEGVITWATKGEQFSVKFPLKLKKSATNNLDGVFGIVKEIVQQFRHLIENNGLNKELYQSNKSPRHESTSQRLFFAVAYAYCRANNVDVSPEIDTGSGKIDFKFSSGFNNRVLVEIKLSTNPKTISGYQTQLEVYKAAEETMKAIYLVIDVGRMGRKDASLIKIRNEALKRREPLSDLEFVDGKVKATASKR